MKRCPECRRDYYDDTLSFCLSDGALLVYGLAGDEPATAILSEPPALAGGQFSESATRPQIPTTAQEAEPKNQLEKATEKRGFFADRAAKALIAPGLLILVLAGGFLGYRYFSAAGSKQIESIAVMPLVNANGDADSEYLSDGMTETLINSLAQLPNLAVKGRGSVFRYKGKDTEPTQIATELGVEAVLNGRLVRRGDSVTLSLDLVDAASGNQIWGEQYFRNLNEIASLQKEIARDVSKKLEMRLSGADLQRLEKRTTDNAEAYRLYLLGRYDWNKRQKDSLLRAADNFKRAIEIDPDFALAYAGLADCYIVFNTYGVAPPNEAYALARLAVHKALGLDDTLGEAYAALASINDDYDWDFPGAERNYQRAIALNPNYATVHQGYAEHLRMLGRFEEAVAEGKRAVELDPVSVSVNRGLGESLYLAGRLDEAISQFQRTIELDPGFPGTYRDLAECYAIKRLYDDAVTQSRKAVERSDGSSSTIASLAYTLAKAGKVAEARKILKDLDERRKGQFVDGAHLAPVYYALGELDAAFAQLDRSCRDRSPAVRYIKVDPRYGSDFRSDPRYEQVVRKIGLP